MAIVCDFNQTEAYFLALYYQYMAQSDYIHHPGCVIDGKISLIMAKWVKHGPLTLCLRQRINYVLEFLLLLYLNKYGTQSISCGM